MDFTQANERLGNRSSHKIGNHTYLRRREGGDITVKLHDTDVVTFHPDNSVSLNSSGWRTVTTKDRINCYSPWRVYSEKGVWYCSRPPWSTVAFADGIRLYPDGRVEGAGEDPKAELKLRSRVRKYAHAFITALQAGDVPAPSTGDCWYCLMRETDSETGIITGTLHEDGKLTNQAKVTPGTQGKTMGEITGFKGHILAHIEENYFVPSLLVRALEVMPCSEYMRWAIGDCWYPTGGKQFGRKGDFVWLQIEKSLKRYIFQRLGLTS
jgi:hypothetical protein